MASCMEATVDYQIADHFFRCYQHTKTIDTAWLHDDCMMLKEVEVFSERSRLDDFLCHLTYLWTPQRQECWSLSGLIVSSAGSRRVAYRKVKPFGHVIHSDNKSSLRKEDRRTETSEVRRCPGSQRQHADCSYRASRARMRCT